MRVHVLCALAAGAVLATAPAAASAQHRHFAELLEHRRPGGEPDAGAGT